MARLNVHLHPHPLGGDMFDYFLGLPMHALVIHAVVVLVPLTSLIALAYAARAGWRHLLVWPLIIGGVISGVTGFVAAESGEALEKRVLAVRQSTTNLDLLHEHTDWGGRAKIVCLVFMVVALAAAWFVRPASSGPTQTRASDALELPLLVLLVIVALAALVVVALTGHSGAAVTWAGLG